MKREVFGRLPDGQLVEVYELVGGRGISARILTFGGIVQGLRVPDRDGHLADIVLGGAELDFYLRRHPYMGCITGRVAGRITGGKFLLGDREYALEVNNPPNHLHGGVHGLDRRIWRAEPEGEDTLRLFYRSPDGEEGYPGNIDITVTYRLTGDGELVFETEVASDEPTPVSLTNHTYFNLAGEGSGPVDDHCVQILAEAYVPTDANLTLSGIARGVAGTAADLRQSARFGDFVPHLHLQHGDHYLLPGGGILATAARARHPGSGRALEVRTDESSLQFYTGVALDGSFTGKSGRPYEQHHGFCLECHGYPDGIAHPEFGEILVLPGQPRRRTTFYAFDIVPDHEPSQRLTRQQKVG